MSQNNFQQRKKDVLSKLDKSSKKSWDKKILKLCEKINSKNNYYTTSSCSGRIVLIIDQDKKDKNLFFKIYHNPISINQFKKNLNEILKKNKKSIKFKQEPFILHIVCKSLKDVQELLNKAKLAGLKKSGIIALKKRIILELNSTEKLEFPIIDKGRILVDDKFLKLIIEKSNENLKKSWKKIEKLRKSI
jgi:tRNA wybutosine-synthesizing protein 3